MDAEAIEKEAHAAALVQVAQMFQRPDQLEKLESLQKRADRKKVSETGKKAHFFWRLQKYGLFV